MLHTLIVINPLLYWPGLLALFCIICRVWYYLGSTRLASVRPRRSAVRWTGHVSHRFFLWQIGAFLIAGKFDSSERELAASLIVQVR